MYEKCEVKVLVVQLWPTLCNPMAHQGSLSKGFSRQEYWNGLPFSSPKDLPDSVIELESPALQVDSLLSEPPRKPPGGSMNWCNCCFFVTWIVLLSPGD